MMRSIRATALVLLIATPLLSGCEAVTEPVSPETTIERQDGLLGGLLGGVLGLLGNILGGADANGPDMSAWIGPAGGTITSAAYTLTVPAGAVATSTRFDVEPANDGTYKIDLHAYRRGLLGLGLIDVGGNGFNLPVQLKISYANANGSFNPSQLVIIYIRPNGTPEIQTSTINTTTETVTSSLSHFSRYALSQNRR